jgi:hypothetical protein
MTAAELVLWIGTLPLLRDGTKLHSPIPRDPVVTQGIAIACVEDDDPYDCASTEDYLAAHESGYHAQIAGDCPGLPAGDLSCTRAKGARSCGAFQLSCDVVKPTTSIETQARMAWRTWKQWRETCPKHPMWGYALGACAISATADRYERELRAHKIAGGLQP